MAGPFDLLFILLKVINCNLKKWLSLSLPFELSHLGFALFCICELNPIPKSLSRGLHLEELKLR